MCSRKHSILFTLSQIYARLAWICWNSHHWCTSDSCTYMLCNPNQGIAFTNETLYRPNIQYGFGNTGIFTVKLINNNMKKLKQKMEHFSIATAKKCRCSYQFLPEKITLFWNQELHPLTTLVVLCNQSSIYSHTFWTLEELISCISFREPKFLSKLAP